MQWDEDGTTLAFCGRHTLDYFDWDGTDRDFVKMVATPKKTARQTELRSWRCDNNKKKIFHTA